MKDIICKCILMASVAFLFACAPDDDFLEEKLNGKIFVDTFYGNKDELDMANNALYRVFSEAFHAHYTTLIVALYGGDDVTTPYNGLTSYVQNDTYVRQGANEDLKGGWSKAYLAINTANGIINYYHQAKGAVDSTLLLTYAAQAHFVRAYLYFWLVRIFNEIPYVDTAREADRTRSLSQPEEIYDKIIQDLKIAEEWLPESWQSIDASKQDGAVTKIVATATLAQVYLTMAGYPLQKVTGPDYPSGEATEYYRLAKEKAKEVIDQRATYGFRLLDHYEEVWDPTVFTHDEMVFKILYNTVAGNYSVWGPTVARPVQFGGSEAWCAEINFFNRFPAGERKTFTFVTEFPLESNSPFAEPSLPWPEDKPMLPWQNMFFKHPYYNKHWEAEFCYGKDRWRKLNNSTEWRCSRTNQMIRYAEILLIYAEAQAMADKAPDALAYDYINQVRNRAYAGVGSTDKNLQPGLDYKAFRDSVFVERGWEFAGLEFASRYFDLVRLELVEDAANATPENKFLPGRATTEYPINSQLFNNKSSHDIYFCPIPDEDVLLNSNLRKD